MGTWEIRRKAMRGCIKERGRGVLDGDFLLLPGIVAEGEDVASEDECRSDEFEAVAREGREGVNEKEVFKGGADVER